MTTQELYDYILVNTNQYFVGKENFEISEDVLNGLVKKALNIWGDYFPVNIISPINISSNKMKLTEIEDHFGTKRIVRNVLNIYYSDYTKFPYNARDSLKVIFQWKFDNVRKVLYSSITGYYYIEASCNPTLDDIQSNEDEFLDIMVGLSLVYIGHNRTDFALSELPFEIRDLRDEGNEIIEKAKERLDESRKTNWSDAISLL